MPLYLDELYKASTTAAPKFFFENEEYLTRAQIELVRRARARFIKLGRIISYDVKSKSDSHLVTTIFANELAESDFDKLLLSIIPSLNELHLDYVLSGRMRYLSSRSSTLIRSIKDDVVAQAAAAQPKRSFKGWRPDLPDFRDHYFAPAPTAFFLPTRVARLGLGNPIEDQGELGSCTGNSSTSALEIVLNPGVPLSRLMAYYNGRLIEGTQDTDSGAYIRDVVKGLSKSGCSMEALWPYNATMYNVAPTAPAIENGLSLVSRVASYERVTTLRGLKTALSKGLPVIFGFSVPEYFMSPEVATSGWIKFPTAADKFIGGHAVVAVGYDDAPTTGEPFVWVRNSWGPSWGLEGYFKMPYKWFTSKKRLVDDMWTIHPKR